MSDSANAASSNYVQSLVRGLGVIRAFDVEHPEMTLSEVAARTDLTRATARRFLLTLADLGYVKTDGRQFSLTARVLELGFSYLSALSLPEIAQPHLEALATLTHESTSASVLDGADIVYVARVPTRRIMSVSINIGTRFPAYATSMGRVLLAAFTPEALEAFLASIDYRALTPHSLTKAQLVDELGRVRTQGWALVDQELEEGLRSVAAPIRHGGQVVGAINVSTAAAYHSVESIVTTIVPAVLETAAQIGADLSASRPFAR